MGEKLPISDSDAWIIFDNICHTNHADTKTSNEAVVCINYTSNWNDMMVQGTLHEWWPLMLTSGPGLYLWLSNVSANERMRYINNILFHSLRNCSAIARRRSQITDFSNERTSWNVGMVLLWLYCYSLWDQVMRCYDGRSFNVKIKNELYDLYKNYFARALHITVQKLLNENTIGL